ncbi:MAG: hypothetical protein ACO3A4_01790 [Silvanigrellaceae bacterium]
MHEQINQHLVSILERRLETESQRWLAAAKSGFTVAVICHDKEVHMVIEGFISRRPQLSELRSPSTTPGDESTLVRSETVEPRAATRLTIHYGHPKPGLGAICFEIPPLPELLPPASTMVVQILENTQLEKYIDAFDGKKMSLLKKILESSGPERFFDAVVQVAYLAGYRGEDVQAYQTLEKTYVQIENSKKNGYLTKSANSENGNPSAMELVFDKIIALPDPHDVLKASLAYYVFHGRNLTQSEASRILKVSRSTLQSHLQLAEHLNVAEYFLPEKNHA